MTTQFQPQQQQSIQSISILWMDDESDGIINYARALEREGNGIPLKVEIATSILEARRKLREAHYAALIVDCRMDTIKPADHNGAQFLLEVNEKYKYLPTFVYTGYKDDPLYEEKLKSSNAIYIAQKTERFDRPLTSHPFFRELNHYAKRYYKVIEQQPEKIEFQHYLAQPEHYRQDVDSHWQRNGFWITQELQRKGWIWGVVCGTEIIDGSADLFDFPTEEKLKEIGQGYNRIPFAYSLAEEPETINPPDPEVPWNSTNTENDYYPTLKVRICEQELIDDFDTGACQTIVSDELISRGVLNFLQDYEASHLGRSYKYFTKKISLNILSENGKEISTNVSVRVVINWNTSPFIIMNSRRRALLGRDLLRRVSVEVVLNSQNRMTRVREI